MDNRSNNHNLQNGYYNNTERALLAARRASRNTVINGDSRSIRTDSVLPQTYAFFYLFNVFTYFISMQQFCRRPNQTSVSIHSSLSIFRPNSSLPPRQKYEIIFIIYYTLFKLWWECRGPESRSTVSAGTFLVKLCWPRRQV